MYYGVELISDNVQTYLKVAFYNTWIYDNILISSILSKVNFSFDLGILESLHQQVSSHTQYLPKYHVHSNCLLSIFKTIETILLSPSLIFTKLKKWLICFSDYFSFSLRTMNNPMITVSFLHIFLRLLLANNWLICYQYLPVWSSQDYVSICLSICLFVQYSA